MKRVALMFSIAAGLSVVASSLVLAQGAPKVETVLTLPQEPNGQLENIAEGPDGGLYVTAPFDRIIWKIKDGKAQKFASFPTYELISSAAGDDDEVVVSVHTTSPLLPRTPGMTGSPRNPKAESGVLGPHSAILDKAGKVQAIIPYEEDKSLFFNGLARAGDHFYLMTAGEKIISLDSKTRKLELWYQNPQVRVNGIKVYNGWVYLPSNNQVYRVRMGPDRKAMGDAVVFAPGGPADDLGVAPDGTLYIPSGTTMLKVTPAGQTSVFLTDIETNLSPAAWVTRDGKWLYWLERLGPAKVKRVALK